MDPFLQLIAAGALMSGGRNEGALVPIDDATDFAKGATHIPGEVTVARRRGERVVYFEDRNEWRMPDGRFVK